MDIFSFAKDIIGFQNTPLLGLVLKGVLGYLAIMWLALVIWVARDIIERSNSLIFQVSMTILNIALPVFGLLIYLIIRPSKTLLERYYEEMEYKVLLEGNEQQEEKCPRCDESLKAMYSFCPNCQEQIKNTCKHCKEHFSTEYKICPFCGKKQTASENEDTQKPRSLRKIGKKEEKESVTNAKA